MEKQKNIKGFRNLYNKEFNDWWQGHQWILKLLLWVIVLNGMMAFVLFLLGPLAESMGEEVDSSFDPIAAALSVLFQIGTTVYAVGGVISSQDLIFSERENGQTEWLLSKPISRSAYILAKFWSNFFNYSINNIFIPILIGYFLVSIFQRQTYPIAPFLIAVSGLLIHTFFYIALCIYLGVASKNRNSILGVSLGFLFTGVFLVFILGNVVSFTPWIFSNILTAIALDMEIPFPWQLPYVVTMILGILFLILTIKKFDQMDL